MVLHTRRTGGILIAALAMVGAIALAGCDPQTVQKMHDEQERFWHPENGPNPPDATAPVSTERIIVLAEFIGASRYGDAERLAKELTDRKWNSVQALHDDAEQRSYVCMGPFKSSDEIHKMLLQVHEYQAGTTYPFRTAYEKDLPPPNPPAPAEWNLANAPSSAAYSLQVAHFVDPSPAFPATQTMKLPPDWNRKVAAVEACKAYRALNLEAYYYHDKTMSLVTLGLFKAEVFRYVPSPSGAHYEGWDRNTDTYVPEVQNLRQMILKDADGKPDKPFMFNTENGRKVTKVTHANGGTYRNPDPSFLVNIPRPQHDVQ